MNIKNIGNYQFVNESGNTRNGFFHKTTLFKKLGENGEQNSFVAEARASYINRTWESYAFQSVMNSVVYNEIEEAKGELKTKVKRELDIGRMTKKAKELLAEYIKNNGYIAELEELLKQL